MTTRTKNVSFASLVAGMSLLLIASLIFSWPLWAWLLLVGGLALLAVVSLRRPAYDSRSERGPEEEVIPPPLPYEQQTIERVSLPSAVPHYSFHFSATVYHRGTERAVGVFRPSLAALALDDVLSRARATAENETPEKYSLVRQQLTHRLGVPRTDRTGLVEIVVTDITLVLSDSDTARLEAMADVRKDEELHELQRQREIRDRSYLSDDVLKSPGAAVVWWLTKNANQVDTAVNLIGTLAQLSAAANDDDVSAPFLHMAPFPPPTVELNGSSAPPPPKTLIDSLRELMRQLDLDPEAVEPFVHRFAQYVRAAGRADEADQILKEFDLLPDPEDWETEDDPAEPEETD
ncbi:hypothetical protein Acor_33220 [Acrocarpospora corrugata]|uniref:Uncharacterized protein n=1 Tax=Acrocarpospora corrugata TaxID=35763 RepID=A0A5M3W3T1_9ACTN|nr:hypothetical protein [Acrocarpospora corrugata]GES01258.1 hypothetical protein Acor_33220 [Acrocarpospora corrugata]